MKGKIHGSSAKTLLQVVDSFDTFQGAHAMEGVVVYIAHIMDDNPFWMVEDEINRISLLRDNLTFFKGMTH